jgi:hypothetical protein
MLIITHWQNLLNPVGRREPMTWDRLFAWLSKPAAFEGKNLHPGWSPVAFADNRRAKAGIEECFAMGLDFDGTMRLEQAREKFGAWTYILHTTKSHTEAVHRFRIVLALSRTVSAQEFDQVWLWINRFCCDTLDRQARDPSRFWYAPAKGDGPFECSRCDEGAVDVDSILAEMAQWDAARKSAVESSRRPETTPILDRARAYVAKMEPAISGSGGHSATWAVAIVLAKGFGLTEDETLEILRTDYNPRCQPEWSEKELAHKAKQAKQANVPEGFVLDRSRELPPRQARDADREFIPDVPAWIDDMADDRDAPNPEDEPAEESEPAAAAKTAIEHYGVLTVRDLCQQVVTRAREGKQPIGCCTGIADLDATLGGFRPGNVTVLGASTSWGKSSLVVATADESIRKGFTPLIVSVEDSPLLYGRRLMCRRSGVNALALRDSECTPEMHRAMIDVLSRAEPEPVLLNAIGKTIEWIVKAVTNLCKERKFDLAILDYIQKTRVAKRTQDRRNEVTYAANLFGDQIKNLGLAGIVCSQLKRIQGREPVLDDLKESGDLENGAEHVILGHIETTKAGVVETKDRSIFVRKNKDGPVPLGAIPTPFDEASASFRRVLRGGGVDVTYDDLDNMTEDYDGRFGA